ncbi:aspartate/glutamate racemase family protein [Enterococcus sp. HY326]|uniref:aspartate/glutamate racemase family protein n=1 Tax=Enterococcus sp. HY326 TaxID=2971265 RepID=UPI00223FCF51|nr:aspartate/glutamate racemase family protein [Enterococcus sp. HY326]
MKTIGLLGGMSWESTVTYYTEINQLINQQLGGLHSAKILLASVDFAEIEELQATNNWQKAGAVLGQKAYELKTAGADFLVICTNTMHKVAPQIEEVSQLPLLHIADATIAELKKQAVKKVLLLGTKYTMTQNFYKERIIAERIEVIIPEESEVEQVNRIIFDELCHGEIHADSKVYFQKLIQAAAEKGATGVILGCTEIGLLIQAADVEVKVFDTTKIHSQKAVEWALNK